MAFADPQDAFLGISLCLQGVIQPNYEPDL